MLEAIKYLKSKNFVLLHSIKFKEINIKKIDQLSVENLFI